jgi:hypothetical protein
MKEDSIQFVGVIWTSDVTSWPWYVAEIKISTYPGSCIVTPCTELWQLINKRTIYLWKNVDIVNMKIDTNTLSSNILKHKHDLQKNIENIWIQLKQGIDNIINKNLPSKQSSATFTNPWANTTIKKLSRRKKKAYNKARVCLYDLPVCTQI